jgi:outer membrane protein OmpA-like peptidoglycan-associated protein
MESRASGWLGYPLRTILTFAALVLLVVLVAVLPVGPASVWMIGGGIVLVWFALIVYITRRHALTRTASAPAITQLNAITSELPLGVRARMPLLLVTGDALALIFNPRDTGDASAERKALIRDGAIWLRVDRIQDLPGMAVAARQWRDGRAPDSVVLCVAPARYADTETLRQSLFMARQARCDAARMLRSGLPGFVAIYQRLTYADVRDIEGSEATWYGFASSSTPPPERFDETVRAAADEAHCSPDPVTALSAATRAANLASLVAWTRSVVLGTLADPRQPAAAWASSGVGWIDCGPASDPSNPWMREIQARTTVTPPPFPATPAPWPLPHPLINAVPSRGWASPRLAALAHGLTLVALAGGLAIWGAGHNNQSLLSRIGADLARFRMIPADHDLARRDALKPLIADRDELDRFGRVGVPLRLSFGMYRAAALRSTLDAAIASYVPPPPPPSPPAIVTLDSMSLFDSARATLRPGSNRMMVGALEMIKAHPDKRILVAGHTDNTGNPDANLKLSQARAASVRDWLIDASGILATQFAIQGYGDTRPVASNDTQDGRAKNRRVEITLVPDEPQK